VACGALAGLAALAAAGGCASKRLVVTSDPSGATVWANDVELGRTPLEAEFTHYGAYDVRVELAGYEVLRTPARARAPWYGYPPMDLAASVIPGTIDTVRWHFVLEPRAEAREPREAFEAGLIERARSLRERVAE
jgi:hypothetical protein